jgi:DNA-binding response OmpR family regulator
MPGRMKDKNIIMTISRGELRDELLLYFGQCGAKVYVTLCDTVLTKLLKTEAIDCILVQMILTNEDAIELVLKVRDINSKIPVILLDQTENHHHDLAARLKVAAYFRKPFSSFEIYQTVVNILGRGEKEYITNKKRESR